MADMAMANFRPISTDTCIDMGDHNEAADSEPFALINAPLPGVAVVLADATGDTQMSSQRTATNTAATPTATANAVEKRKEPMRNVSRERMKAETAFLHTRVVELERELSQCLAKRAMARSLTPSPVWRAMARRQSVRRLRAEEENNRLKAKLLHQLQVAKSLETIFKNRSSGLMMDEALLLESITSEAQMPRYPVRDLEALHACFMDEIDDVYPLVDTVFSERITPQDAMAGSRTHRRSTVLFQHSEGETSQKIYVELRDVNFVPFPFDRVCTATWRAITTEYTRQKRIIDQFCCTDQEYTCKFWLQNQTTPMDTTTASTTRTTSKTTTTDSVNSAVMTMRKFMEPHRMVVIWRSLNLVETALESHEHSDETGWLIVERVDATIGTPSSGSGGDDEASAIIRVCTRYVPIWDGVDRGSSKLSLPLQLLQPEDAQLDDPSFQQLSKVGEFSTRILNDSEEDIAAITESIENLLLLDEAIGAATAEEENEDALLEDMVLLDGLEEGEGDSWMMDLVGGD